ncbi:MAG TPA: L,D-transpeptidase [Thermoanaerobaculia bacterium]|nr:L,D-transpeptidase [Thermoanaerobaculia bacterium]
MKKALPMILAVIVVAACSRERTTVKTNNPIEKVKDKNTVDDVTTPWGGKPDQNAAQSRAQQDADVRWRRLQSFGVKQQQPAQTATTETAPPPDNFKFVTGQKESFKGVDAQGINAAAVNVPISGEQRGPSVLRAQVYLDRIHFAVGSIDGRWGRNSGITAWWYQRARGLEPTGDMDEQTFRRLAAEAQYAPVVKTFTLTADDVKGPFRHIPDDVYEKAKLPHLGYESLKEELSEKFHCTEDFLDVLNPDVKFGDLAAGAKIVVPNVREPMTADQPDIARIIISIAGNSLNGFGANGNIIFHAPSTLGSGYDPSPTETLHIVKIVQAPSFHYDPTLYHEVPDSEPDAQLPSGPNTPVGVVWMALSKPHYGIHGNPEPDSIGYNSSHGCVRLTNWDAEEVSHRATQGTQVSFVDTREKGMPEVAKK